MFSMTPEERHKPDMINGSRRRRIASGSGTTPQEVNQPPESVQTGQGDHEGSRLGPHAVDARRGGWAALDRHAVRLRDVGDSADSGSALG